MHCLYASSTLSHAKKQVNLLAQSLRVASHTCNGGIEAGLVDAVVVPLRQNLAAVIVQRPIQIVLEGKGHNLDKRELYKSALPRATHDKTTEPRAVGNL